MEKIMRAIHELAEHRAGCASAGGMHIELHLEKPGDRSVPDVGDLDPSRDSTDGLRWCALVICADRHGAVPFAGEGNTAEDALRALYGVLVSAHHAVDERRSAAAARAAAAAL